MKEKNEKSEKPEVAEKTVLPAPTDQPAPTVQSAPTDQPAPTDQTATTDQPAPSSPSVISRSPQAAVEPLQQPTDQPATTDQPAPSSPSVISRSPQAAVEPLQQPTDQPAPSLASLATKACQSLSDMEDTDIQALTHLATSLLEDIEKGKLRKRNVKALLRSLHYDRDIAAASHEGEIKGRNAKIEELLAERERTSNIHMPTGARTNLTTTPPPHVIGGLAAADRRTIWERGNEKRTVY